MFGDWSWTISTIQCGYILLICPLHSPLICLSNVVCLESCILCFSFYFSFCPLEYIVFRGISYPVRKLRGWGLFTYMGIVYCFTSDENNIFCKRNKWISTSKIQWFFHDHIILIQYRLNITLTIFLCTSMKWRFWKNIYYFENNVRRN